jgi:hypothetical protein
MLRRRIILLVLTVCTVLGSTVATVSYARYLHSRCLLDRVTADLSRRMGLDVRIGRLTPLSFSARRFDDIEVRLPGQDTQTGRIEHAVWRSADSGAADSRALDLCDGWLLVGSGRWASTDYERLLKSGFGHDFSALRLAEVNVANIEFRWRHPSLSMTAPGANGVIFFDETGKGRAALTVEKLNDTVVEEPIHVAAWFTPGAGMAFQKVELRVGDVPLGALGLAPLLGGAVESGTFRGQITYREGTPPPWSIEVGGSLRGAHLEELTRQLIGGPFHGIVDVEIDRAWFAPSTDGPPELRGLRFGGRVSELQLAQFAELSHEPELQGRIDLTIHQAEYDRPDVRYARLSGSATDVSLEALTRILGYGVVTGQLDVRVNALAIVDNVVQFADVDLLARPPASGSAYIEKSALATIGQRVFGLDLAPLLPERVEYVQMGAKLLIDREGLRVRGTHGPDGRTILTVKLLGREVGILKQPNRTYPVDDLVGWVRTHLAGHDVDELYRWWKQQGTPATSMAHPG